MRINNLFIKPQYYQYKSYDKVSDKAFVNTNNLQYKMYVSNSREVAFYGASPKYARAKAYIDNIICKHINFDKKATDIYSLNLNRADGIQEGIKVFEGLNLKEIAFIAKTIMNIALNRGCNNLCSHCYADAKPSLNNTSEYISSISWEDFKLFTNGLNELNERLGFYITSPNLETKGSSFYRYIAPFHDSDCINLVLKDINGKEYDFIDISNEIIKSTGLQIMFDTAGWTPQNKKAQQRAEKYVKYFLNDENYKNITSMSISINPFHVLCTRSIEETRLGNIAKAKKFRDLYTTRMANTLFTYTPLINEDKVNLIIRAIDNYVWDNKKTQGFLFSDLANLYTEILDKLRAWYKQDLNSTQKYIKKEKQIDDLILKLQDLYRICIDNRLILAGRALKYFGKDNSYFDMHLEHVKNDVRKVHRYQNVHNFLEDAFAGVLDANGRYYITTFHSTFPTELRLNFLDKNKKTAPINPEFMNLPITKQVINNTEK